MSWIKKGVFLLIGWLIIVIPLLLVVEISLRIFNDEWTQADRLNIIRDTKINYVVDHLYNSKYTEINYSRDRFGLRGGCNDPADIDILSIGGSTTDQRYVDDKFTYQSSLSRALSSHLGKEICISNAGVDGHTTFGHISSFEYWFPQIEKLKPKFFLLYIGLNDADFINNTAREGYDNQLNRGFKPFLKKFEVVKILLRTKNIFTGLFPRLAYGSHSTRQILDEDYSVTEVSSYSEELALENAKSFEERLKKIMGFIERMGSKPICVTQPHRFVKEKSGVKYGLNNLFDIDDKEFSGLDFDFSLQKINESIKKVCGLENTIDLYNYNFQDIDFYDYVHTTPQGSTKIGLLLADEIIGSSLIDKF
tara:strand:- start:1058 stop:2149 length:1092 start_codon:yes stop_codon:yes gene_type:complete